MIQRNVFEGKELRLIFHACDRESLLSTRSSISTIVVTLYLVVASFTHRVTSKEREKQKKKNETRSCKWRIVNVFDSRTARRRCLFNTEPSEAGTRDSHLSYGARFLSLLLTTDKDKGEGDKKGVGEEEKEPGARKCRPVITSLRVIYSGREASGINHGRWR